MPHLDSTEKLTEFLKPVLDDENYWVVVTVGGNLHRLHCDMQRELVLGGAALAAMMGPNDEDRPRPEELLYGYFEFVNLPTCHQDELGVLAFPKRWMDRKTFARWLKKNMKGLKINGGAESDIAILANREGMFVIKRIIALGGETIEGREGKIFLNGRLLSEPYVTRSGAAAPLEIDTFGPLQVPAGKVFVMGDSRDISLDSRSPEMGPLEVASLRGKALYTLQSLKNGAFKFLK